MKIIPQDNELNSIKYQVANFAYDLFSIMLERSGNKPELTFDELEDSHRNAWTEAVWEASQIAKTKVILSSQQETITKKQDDNGYLVYGSARLINKKHPELYTYDKFPEYIKEEYRQLAMKIYNKIDGEIVEVV